MKRFVFPLLILLLFGISAQSFATDRDVGNKIKTEINCEQISVDQPSAPVADIVFCQRTEVASGFATIQQGRSVELIEIRCYQHNAYTNNCQKHYTSPLFYIFKKTIIQQL